MNKNIIILLSLIYMFCATQSFAEDYQKVNLQTAMEIAQENNLDIKSSKIDVDIMKNEIKASNRLQNPSLETT